MEFNEQNYDHIKMALKAREEVEFTVPKDETGFSNTTPPDSWLHVPPVYLPPEGYAHIFLRSGTDRKGALTRLELLVHMDGGKTLYKDAGNEIVAIKVIWPD